jgi:phosphoserine phosphatase RsbU/P
MVYAEVDLVTGRGSLVQAGHPHPVILRGDGRLERIGEGGLPIGLVPGATYDRVEFRLRCGDRLLLVSDGITECPGPMGHDLGDDGLDAMLRRNAGLDSPALLETIPWELAAFSGMDDFPDDVSGVIFDYLGESVG